MDPSNATLQLQAMTASSMEECSKPQEKKLRPPQEQSLKCPRCDSTNTKFCYYNNYSLSQPRYFCKGCKRYWTQGGTLRNVPVGGGCRKNTKRSSSSSSSSSSKRTQDDQLVQLHISSTNSNNHNIIPTLPLLTYDSNDLTLAFASLHNTHQNHDHYANSFYGIHNPNPNPNPSTNMTTSTTFFDALKCGFLDTQGGISHNMYNGFGNQELGEVLSGAEEIFLPYEDMSGSTTTNTTTATTVTTTRQEDQLCRGRDGEMINKGFWNFPWQQQQQQQQVVGGGDQGSFNGDGGREYWNGLGSSSWHGLVNSPLM